jgi:Glutathione S-transferase, C-terminal domain
MRLAVPRLPPADAAAAYKSYLRRLANMLEEQPFLLGSAPCVADFAAYHPLWFTRHCTSAMAGILDATPGVLAWMDRMAAIGTGSMGKFNAAEAIALAARSTPAALPGDAFQNEHGIALGSRVVITSDSFGPEPTEGELIAATRTRYSLRRVDERAGEVHVHFPRIGYVLKAVQPA